MFNKNYMNHDLVDHLQGGQWSGRSVICKNCNQHLIYYSRDIDDDSDDNFYRLYTDNGFTYPILLNCQEFIIKNIIE
jgi:hypothetical protein